MGWDVPIVGQTTLGSGQTKALLEKPEYWDKVYQNNFRSSSFEATETLPPRTSEFLDRLRAAKIEMGDTLLWWIAIGYDAPRIIADAVKAAASRRNRSPDIGVRLKAWPGAYGDMTLSPSSTTASGQRSCHV